VRFVADTAHDVLDDVHADNARADDAAVDDAHADGAHADDAAVDIFVRAAEWTAMWAVAWAAAGYEQAQERAHEQAQVAQMSSAHFQLHPQVHVQGGHWVNIIVHCPWAAPMEVASVWTPAIGSVWMPQLLIPYPGGQWVVPSVVMPWREGILRVELERDAFSDELCQVFALSSHVPRVHVANAMFCPMLPSALQREGHVQLRQQDVAQDSAGIDSAQTSTSHCSPEQLCSLRNARDSGWDSDGASVIDLTSDGSDSDCESWSHK